MYPDMIPVLTDISKALSNLVTAVCVLGGIKVALDLMNLCKED
jgi:hypothetical protein